MWINPFDRCKHVNTESVVLHVHLSHIMCTSALPEDCGGEILHISLWARIHKASVCRCMDTRDCKCRLTGIICSCCNARCCGDACVCASQVGSRSMTGKMFCLEERSSGWGWLGCSTTGKVSLFNERRMLTASGCPRAGLWTETSWKSDEVLKEFWTEIWRKRF